MTLAVTHTFVSPISDNHNPNQVGPDEWNDSHTLTGLLSSSQLDLSMSPTWTGSHTFNSTVAVTPPVATLDEGITVTQQATTGTITGSDKAYNSITINNDFAAVDLSNFASIGLKTFLSAGGASATGTRIGIRGIVNLGLPSTSTGGDFIGTSGEAFGSQPNGGTNTGAGARGTLYGLEGVGWAFSGATNYNVVSGAEFDAVIATGASSKHRWGISISGNGDLRGAVSDSAIEIGAPTSTGAYSTSILWSNFHGFAPVPSTGTLLGTDASSVTADTFANFSTYTFSSYVFNFANFTLTGSQTTPIAKVLGSSSAEIRVNQGGNDIGFLYGDGSQCVVGSIANVPLNFWTNSATHFSIATTGVMSGTFSLAANTSGDGLALVNSTAATSGNQRYSPSLRITSQGWKTDSTAASQTNDWIIDARPVQGTVSPKNVLVFSSQINGGGYTTRMQLSDDTPNASTTTNLDIKGFGAASIRLNQNGNDIGFFYGDGSQCIIGSIANVPTKFYSNSTVRAYMPAASGLVIGDGTNALATNATDGFLYIPTCAGTPTGTPTAQTGTVPMVYDTTNNKLYIRNGGAWKGGTVPGVWS